MLMTNKWDRYKRENTHIGLKTFKYLENLILLLKVHTYNILKD